MEHKFQNKLAEIIKESSTIPGIISKTLDALWVLLLSLMGREIMNIKLNLNSEWDSNSIWCLVLMTACIITYGVIYYKYQNYYRCAVESDKENLFKCEKNDSIERKQTNYFLWNKIKLRFFMRFLVPLILFVFFLFIKS